MNECPAGGRLSPTGPFSRYVSLADLLQYAAANSEASLFMGDTTVTPPWLGAAEHKNRSPMCSLMWAIEREQSKLAAKLIDTNIAVNAVLDHNMTPLMMAVEFGHARLAALLVDEKVDVNAMDNNNTTALMWAVEFGILEEVDKLAAILIDKKADVNAMDSNNVTPLMMAVESGHDNIAAMLVHAKANVNAMDSIGCTPLMLAVNSCAHISVVKLLLNNGSLDASDAHGNTALSLAAANDSLELVAVLEAANTKYNAAQKKRAKRKARRSKRAALVKGMTAGHFDSDGQIASSPSPRPVPDLIDDSCVVCMDNVVTHMCYPCGHMHFCAGCAAHVGDGHCPSCRAPVVHSMAVFRK